MYGPLIEGVGSGGPSNRTRTTTCFKSFDQPTLPPFIARAPKGNAPTRKGKDAAALGHCIRQAPRPLRALTTLAMPAAAGGGGVQGGRQRLKTPRDPSRGQEDTAVGMRDRPGTNTPLASVSRHGHDSAATKASGSSLEPPTPPPTPLSFSRRFLAQSLPLKRRGRRNGDVQRGRARSRTLVNPLVVASDETASTVSSSASTRSSTPGSASTRPDLPVLRYKYVARGVLVLVGSRWRLQPFQERVVELRTGNTPCLLIYPIASDGEREIVGHDTQILPLDTTCQLTSSRASCEMNGLKLSSSKENRAFRVRIRFATAADAVIWSRILQDALRYARWSRHLVSAASLSSAISTTSACSGSSSAASFSSAHSTKVTLFVHLATRKQFVVKSLGAGSIDCNEIKMLKKLSSAPSASARELVAGYRVVETASEVRIIMPKLPGDTLLQFLQRRPRPCTLTEPQARLVAGGLCQRLKTIHAAGIVHCDLKLENIMLADEVNTQIIDFGGAFDLMGVTDVVKSEDSSSSSLGPACSLSTNDVAAMVGTPGYIAPERILRPSDPPSPRADVFSLGVVLFQLLAGQHPYTEAARMHRSLKLSDSLTIDWTKAQTLLIMRGVSVEARQLLRQMLERDPSMRITIDRIMSSAWISGGIKRERVHAE